MSNSYPSDWNSRRNKVYQRDNYTCQNCGAQGGHRGNAELHAHHIVPKSKGGTHKISNLKTLCQECHSAIHGSSMAPSAEINRHIETSNPQKIQVEHFPVSLRQEVELTNILIDLEDAMDSALSELYQYEELAFTCTIVEGDDLSEQSALEYDNNREKLESKLETLHEQLEKLSTIEDEALNPKIKRLYQRFLPRFEIAVDILIEYFTLLDDLTREDSSVCLKNIRNQSLNSDLEDCIDEIEDILSELDREIGQLFNQLEVEIEEKSVSAVANPFNECPICGEEELKKIKKLNMIQCNGCQTEFSGSNSFWDSNLEITHSSRDIEGISMTAAVWKRVGGVEPNESPELQHYVEQSKELEKWNKASIVVWTVITLIVASVISPNGLFGVILIFVIFVGGIVAMDSITEKLIFG